MQALSSSSDRASASPPPGSLDCQRRTKKPDQELRNRTHEIAAQLELSLADGRRRVPVPPAFWRYEYA